MKAKKVSSPGPTVRKAQLHTPHLLQAILDHSPAYIYVKDLAGRLLLSNRLFNERFAATTPPPIAQQPEELSSRDTASLFGRHDAEVLAHGLPVVDEQTNIEQNGSHTYLTINFPIRDAVGEIDAVCGIATDITATKRAESRLRELAGLLDQASDAIFVSDFNNRISYWNRSAEKLFGWTAKEAVGRQPEETFPEFPIGQVTQIRQTLLEHGHWNGEIILHDRTGKECNIDLRASVARDAAGQPNGRMLVCTDITEKKKLQEQFLRAQRVESIGMLATGIAHDLNNILAPIGITTSLLRARTSTPEDLRMLDNLQTCADRGVGLVRQILGFAHGVGGESCVVQVKHLLRDILGMMAETFPKSITLENDLPNDLWPVMANPTQIHQVLLNLCVNARDAMPAGGTLSLRAENRLLDVDAAAAIQGAKPGAWLVLHVEDTGTGIPPEVLAHIWSPFFTTKPVDKGTGLGLSTVHSIVEAHRGFVTVQTTVGRGTIFRAYLPALQPGVEVESHVDVQYPKQTPGDLILLVDDEELIRDTASTILRRAGYRVVTAASNTAAAATFTARPAEFALVITDCELPVFGSDALTEIVRAKNPAAKILAISALGPSGFAGHGKQPVASDAFLPKPFSADALCNAVEQLLTRVPHSTQQSID